MMKLLDAWYIADLFEKLTRESRARRFRQGTRRRRAPIRYYFTSRWIAVTEEPSAQLSRSLPAKAKQATVIKAAVRGLGRPDLGRSSSNDCSRRIEPANNKRD